MKIRIAGIVEESIVDGPGIRLTLFTQGCLHACPNCHNPETHALDKGYVIDTEDVVKLCKENKLLSGITLSGGEPFLQPKECFDIIKKVRNKDFNVIVYTGYTYEELLDFAKENKYINSILNNIDYLVDGKYIDKLRDLKLFFRGSSNQRFIDVKKTLKEKKVVEVIFSQN